LFTDEAGGAQSVDGAHAGNGEVTLALVTAPTDFLVGATSGPATLWSETNAVGGKPWFLGAAPTGVEANDLVVGEGSSVLDSAAANFASDPTVGGHAAEMIGGLELASGADLTLQQDLDVTGAAGQPFGGAGSTITVGTAGASAELFVQSAVPTATGQVNVVHGTYDYAGHGNAETVLAQSGAFVDSGASNTAVVTVESGGTYTDSGVQASAASANHDIVAVSGAAYEQGAYNADSVTVNSGGILTDTGTGDGGAVHLNSGVVHEDGSGATTTVDMTGGGTLYIDNSSFAGAITNFGANGAIGIPGNFDYLGVSVGAGGDHLVFLDTTTLADAFIPISLAAGVTPNEVVQEANGLIGVVVCFASGTHIRTTNGEVAVEDLAVGDLTMTASGEARPIRWIGHRTVTNTKVVRVSAGAFGDAQPVRDLFLSPGHAVCVCVVDEVFVPVGQLINGASITEVERSEVTYWHVELESHDVILAEGLPCESYMDAGNRAFFGREYGRLGEIDPRHAAESLTRYARPFVDHGPIVEAIRSRLAARGERPMVTAA
jgi:hypothetical protein